MLIQGEHFNKLGAAKHLTSSVYYSVYSTLTKPNLIEHVAEQEGQSGSIGGKYLEQNECDDVSVDVCHSGKVFVRTKSNLST